MKTAKLFDNVDDIDDNIKINEAYEQTYNTWKNRELKEKFKNAKISSSGSESDSESEEEDSDAELLTREMDAKILEVVERIRRKDQDVYDETKVFFPEPEEDKEEEDILVEKKPQPLTYTKFISQALLKEGADAIAKEEDLAEKFPTIMESDPKTYEKEQEQLKQSFISAANALDESNDILCKVEKSAQQLKEEEDSFQAFLKRKQEGLKDESYLLSRYLQPDENLDQGEKFLRDYIIFEGWKKTNSTLQPYLNPVMDEDDDQNIEEREKYEAAYNFRFEENVPVEVQGHCRKILDSFRIKENKRKQKRLERAQRKQREKEERKKDLEKIKEIKRQELLERLKVIQKIAGVSEAQNDIILSKIQEDFNPETHDNELQAILGEFYDEQKDENEDELFDEKKFIEADEAIMTARQKQKKKKKLEKKRKKQLANTADDILNHAENSYEALTTDNNISMKDDDVDKSNFNDQNTNEYNSQDENTNQLDDNYEHNWYLCDGCFYGIREGAKRYDCLTCDNFTLCAKCFRSIKHPHNLIRKRVPTGNKPPPEAFEGYYAKEAFKDIPDIDVNPENQALIQKAMDDYWNLDYEDLIGGMPVRFKYNKVEPEDYGMTTEDILKKDDKIINQMVPIKRLAPYRSSRNKSNAFLFGKKKASVKKNSTFNKVKATSSFKINDKVDKKPKKPKKHALNVQTLPNNIPKDRLEAYNVD